MLNFMLNCLFPSLPFLDRTFSFVLSLLFSFVDIFSLIIHHSQDGSCSWEMTSTDASVSDSLITETETISQPQYLTFSDQKNLTLLGKEQKKNLVNLHVIYWKF